VLSKILLELLNISVVNANILASWLLELSGMISLDNFRDQSVLSNSVKSFNDKEISPSTANDLSELSLALHNPTHWKILWIKELLLSCMVDELAVFKVWNDDSISMI